MVGTVMRVTQPGSEAAFLIPIGRPAFWHSDTLPEHVAAARPSLLLGGEHLARPRQVVARVKERLDTAASHFSTL
jgi:hypothetical protein